MRTCTRSPYVKPVTEHFEKLKASSDKVEQKVALLEFARLTSLSLCSTGQLNGLGDIVKNLAAYLSTEQAAELRGDFLSIVRAEKHEGPPTQLLASLLQCPELADEVRKEMREVWLKRSTSRTLSCDF